MAGGIPRVVRNGLTNMPQTQTVEETTGNLVNAFLALLGIAATVFLAFNARSGARHHVENLKIAAEALEKLKASDARTMVDRFVARETVKLEDDLHPDTIAARKSYWRALVTYVAGVLWFAGPSWDLPFMEMDTDWVWWLGLGLFVVGFLIFAIQGSIASNRVTTRRGLRELHLSAAFEKDEERRQE